MREASRAVSGIHTPRPSYPPRTALITVGQPCSAAKFVTSDGSPTAANGGTGTPSSRSRRAHRVLVLRVAQRVRRRGDVHPLGDQGFEVRDRYVFVIESERMRARGGGPQCLEVGVTAEHHIGADLRRRVVRRARRAPAAAARARSRPGASSGRVDHPRPSSPSASTSPRLQARSEAEPDAPRVHSRPQCNRAGTAVFAPGYAVRHVVTDWSQYWQYFPTRSYTRPCELL